MTDEPARDRETVLLGRGVEGGPRRATAAPDPLRGRVNRDGPHPREIHDETTLADGAARIVVAAATHRDLEALASSERDCARHVVRIPTLRDDGGAATDLAGADAAVW